MLHTIYTTKTFLFTFILIKSKRIPSTIFVIIILFNVVFLHKIMEEYLTYGYFGLFSISFLAATILPVSSEAVFIALLASKLNPTLLLLSATIGNWIGGMTNYYLGYLGKVEWIEKYFHIPIDKIKKIKEKIYNKGAYMAFFCFLPAIGDIIGFALGFVRANIIIVNISMFLGKLFRYIVLLYAFEHGIKYLLP